MTSVADRLARERREANLTRTAAERLRLAIELGRTNAQRYASAHGVSLDAARTVFQRQRQTGRRRSAAHESLLQ